MPDTDRLINKDQGDSIIAAIQGITSRLQEMYTVDDALSSTSENPVQNKVVKDALDGKVDTVSGKGLSTNDYTTAEKEKLAGIEEGAQVNTVVPEDIESTQTVSGNPITLTDAAPINAESLVVELEPKQDLHGYDFPWVGGSHYNQWDEVWEVGNIDRQGQDESSDTTIRSKNYIPCQSNTEYRVLIKSLTANNIVVYFYDTNKSLIPYTGQGAYNNGYNGPSGVFTTPNGTAYMRFRTTSTYGAVYNNDIAINYPSSITTYAPYSNICPISGYEWVEVEDHGKNFIGKGTQLNGFVISQNMIFYAEANSVGYYFETKDLPNVITMNAVNGNRAYYGYFNEVPVDMATCLSVNQTQQILPNTITVDKTYKYIHLQFSYNQAVSNVQVEKGSTATPYEPYHSSNATIQFGQTVYGGSVDFLTGVLTVDRAYVNMGDLTWTYYSIAQGNLFRSSITDIKPTSNTLLANCICSQYSVVTQDNRTNGTISSAYNTTLIDIIDNRYSDASTFKTAMDGVQLVYELAEPQTIQLTPQELQLLKGTNNITTNGTTINLGYQPDNVIGEVKGEIEAITEMDYLKILDNNVETPVNNYRIYYHLISGAYTLVNMGEMLNHRFIFVEVVKNPSGGINKKVLHSALIDPRTIDGFEYEMKASGNDTIWIESILDENKFSLSLRTTGGSYSDGDPTDYYVTIRMVD